MTSKEVIKKLTDDGWLLRGIKGSQHIYIHQHKSGHISVPHPKKDLGIGLVKKLLKLAGLD
jgi:predicted RNA binding protein YcfA (HicA-like mRNA interferase family)